MSCTLVRASAAMSAAATSTTKQQVIHMYRQTLRAARSIPSYNHRGHVLQKARASYRANAQLQSSEEVAFAVQLGDTQLDNIRAQATHMKQIMHETNTLSHDAPKPDRMYAAPSAAAASTTLGATRRSFHTSARSHTAATATGSATATSAAPLASLLPNGAAVPTAPSAFWAGGVAPDASAGQAKADLFGATPVQGVPLVATHIVHVLLTPNNAIITLANLAGQAKAWSSSGTCGFKNSKKSTYMACIAAGEQLGHKARNQNVKSIDMHVSGFHKNKKAVLKGLMKAGLNIVAIRDTTPIPFNGCKPRKQRRL